MINVQAIERRRAATLIAERVTRKLIRTIQRLPPGLLEGEGALNLWDEVCIQARRDSPWLDRYKDEIADRLEPLVITLSGADKLMLWLESGPGEIALAETDESTITLLAGRVKVRDIVDYLITDHLTSEMLDYDNGRIRTLTGN